MIFKTTLWVMTFSLSFVASVSNSNSWAGSYLAGSNAAMRGDYVAASKYFAETLVKDLSLIHI